MSNLLTAAVTQNWHSFPVAAVLSVNFSINQAFIRVGSKFATIAYQICNEGLSYKKGYALRTTLVSHPAVSSDMVVTASMSATPIETAHLHEFMSSLAVAARVGMSEGSVLPIY